MHLKTCVVLFCALFGLATASGSKNWWQHGVFYQVYPRSFMDSTGDGVGDLQGIISKLEHLKDIGVTAAWLSPIYKSPQVDAGYDISDYRDIHEEYGTLKDFDELIEKANKLGIKVVMDLVPNHSSDQHEWFVKSEKGEAEYKDYYVWVNGTDDGITPPNNWISAFKYSAWKWSKIRKQWYLHQFAPEQPDLNYENPKVVQEMLDVMEFWLDKGVYGFRVDAVPTLCETGLKDEPRSNLANVTEEQWEYLDHIYTKDQPRTFEVVYQFREFLDNYNKAHPERDESIMMTEAYTTFENCIRYYGNGKKLGAHFAFNFDLVYLDKESTAYELVAVINRWANELPKKYTSNWVLGNHDRTRVATRVGIENADGWNMLLAILPGVGVTYNGEEIGMENGEVSWAEGQDPNACNGRPEDFHRSRDFERTPFQWNDKKNAGFSAADKTWLPVSKKYHEVNLEKQSGVDGSHKEVYKKMLGLRKSSTVLQRGTTEAVALDEQIILVTRRTEDDAVHLLFNFGQKEKIIDLKNAIGNGVKVYASNSKRNSESLLDAHNMELQPHECLVMVSME